MYLIKLIVATVIFSTRISASWKMCVCMCVRKRGGKRNAVSVDGYVHICILVFKYRVFCMLVRQFQIPLN